MRHRQAFTLVELLVAMALVMFIMAILSTAFVEAMGAFRNLKVVGDMTEKLRATTQLLQRDLSADHFEGKKRLSNPNFWLNGPTEQGFFQISQGSAGTAESTFGDIDNIDSFLSANHSLAFTIKLRGNQMSDFLSASAAGGGSTPLVGLTPPANTLAMLPQFGPLESRYQIASTSGDAYNNQWAEVAWFLQPSINPTTGQQDTTVADTQANTPALPLWILYRRQRLLVPDNSQIPPQPAGNAAQFLEVSCWPKGGNLYFNSPIDITDPQRRFGSGVGAYSPIPQGQGALSGSDIQLNDVISFDVRVLVQGMMDGVDPFVTLFDPRWTAAPPEGLGFTYSAPPGVSGMVFDTWTNINDGLGSSYAQWNLPAAQQNPPAPGTTIPFWNGTSGPTILAIQISLRIWDYKTNQTRQVTMVQAM